MKKRKKKIRTFVSTFKTTEDRITYQQKEQILAILAMEEHRWITCARIVNKASSFGWTTPLKDDDRLAMSHPYWRVLTSMIDENNYKFTNNLERRLNENGDFIYKIHKDKFKKNGVWYKKTKKAISNN